MRKLALVAMGTAVMLSFAACSKDNGAANENATPTPIEGTEDTTGNDTNVEDTTEGTTEETTDAASDEMAKLQAYRDAVAASLGEGYIPSMQYSEEEISELFGLTPDMYTAVLAEGPMMSVHVDTFVAVRPAEGKLDAVVAALEAYRDMKQADTMQYPMNLSKIQACRVETIGDYVFFLMVGTFNEMLDSEEAEIEAFTALNQQAVDAIKAAMENE